MNTNIWIFVPLIIGVVYVTDRDELKLFFEITDFCLIVLLRKRFYWIAWVIKILQNILIFSFAATILPDSNIPQLHSDFVGRSKECEHMIASMMSQSIRVYNIWGPPGFGKTSTAIAIGKQLKDQGENVYYFSFRGVSTMKEFTSKLLGQFGRLIDLHPCVNIEPTDQLLHVFGSIKARMFVILDNLDDILTPRNQKEAMLNFIIDVLQRCPYVKLLTTTRESLQFVNLRVKEFVDSLRLKPLDAESSSSLVLKLIPTTKTDLRSQISKMCGNVPLAIRLLCSLIEDSPQEFLDEILNGSECLLDVIDDDDFPPDARLKELIRTLFNKLSDVEKGAFVSLSLFGGAEFGLEAGIAIVGGSKREANSSIKSLKKKSLIDIVDEMCEIHPLIQSFASEKGQNEMESVLESSRTRFFEYYINLFEKLNTRFLAGDSMSAFKMFYMEEQRIFTSLTDGLSDSKFLEKVVSILKECEFFLDALYHNNLGKTKDLYNSALSKVSGEDHAELYPSSVFFQTIIVTKVFCPSEDETSREIALLPLSVQAKLECYKGIYVLSNGGGEPAAQRIEAGLIQLENNNPQHVILKILGFQLLAIFYKSTNKHKQFLNKTAETCTANSVFRYVPLLGKPVKNEEKACFSDPLAAWAIARLSLWARKYRWFEEGTEYGNSLASFLKQISVEASKLDWTIESSTLLQLIDKAQIFAGIKYEVLNDENGDQALIDERKATRYHTLAVNQCWNGESTYELYLKELEIRQKLPLNSKLADCYKHIGIEQRSRRQYSSAVESYMFALQVFQQHYGHGEMHEDVAKSYCRIADAQENMGKKELSIQSYRSALEIYLHLYGDCHLYSVMIKEHINCLLKCPLVCTSIECCQNLSNLHSYLYSNNFSLRCRGLGRREQVTEKCCCVLI